MHLNGGPLEKQRQLKSQPSLKTFNNNNSNKSILFMLLLAYLWTGNEVFRAAVHFLEGISDVGNDSNAVRSTAS